jgi:hypothetical protein
MFKLLIITDTIIPYAWMGLLIALSAHQEKFDRWNKSNTKLLDELVRHAKNNSNSKIVRHTLTGTVAIAVLSLAGGSIAVWASTILPSVKNVLFQPDRFFPALSGVGVHRGQNQSGGRWRPADLFGRRGYMDNHSRNVSSFGGSTLQGADGFGRGGQPVKHRRACFRPGYCRYLSS